MMNGYAFDLKESAQEEVGEAFSKWKKKALFYAQHSSSWKKAAFGAVKDIYGSKSLSSAEKGMKETLFAALNEIVKNPSSSDLPLGGWIEGVAGRLGVDVEPQPSRTVLKNRGIHLKPVRYKT